MKSYGLNVDGPLIIERVDALPLWTASSIGRIIYDKASSTYWIAGDTIDDGVNGWIQFGLTTNSVLSNYINWDIYFNDPNAISSQDIPTRYLDTTSNVQVVLDSIGTSIIDIRSGTLLDDHCIINRHIGFTSEDIPFANLQGKYNSSLINVEQVLNFLRYTTADQILFKEPHSFGLGIGSNASNIQQAVVDIDAYLGSLTADKVKALIPATSVWSSVQSVLDLVYSNISNITFVDLVGTPNTYGINKQFVKTNGLDTVYFSDIYASDIICQYPGTQQNTVQGALSIILSNINELSGGTLSIDAHDVSYDDSPSIGLNNVDDVLDYLIRECFTSANLPEATQIRTVGIGNSNNLQSSLEFIQNEVDSLLAAINGTTACSSPFSPISFSSNALVTLSDINQNYLLLTHTYGGSASATVLVSARIVIGSSSRDQDIIASINNADVITVDKNLLYPGYTISLMAKMTLTPNTTINLTVKTTTDGCHTVSVKDYRMLIEPSL